MLGFQPFGPPTSLPFGPHPRVWPTVQWPRQVWLQVWLDQVKLKRTGLERGLAQVGRCRKGRGKGVFHKTTPPRSNSLL